MNTTNRKVDQDESYVNVLVNDPLSGEKRVDVITQEVVLHGRAEIIVRYLLIALESGNWWFSMNTAAQLITQSKNLV